MSTAILLVAAIEMVALIWAFWHWLTQKDNLALTFAMTVLLAITLDAFSNGVGRFVGVGETLETLVRFRMIFFFATMPLLIAISILFLGYAGVSWARNKGVIATAIGLVAAVGVYQFFAYRDMALYPSCVFDVVRYVMEVRPDQACRLEDTGLGELALSPVVPISAMALLLTAVALVWITRFWWVALLFLASNLASAVTVQIPQEGMMIYVSYPFDGLLGFMLCFVAIKLYGRQKNTT